MRIKMLRNWTIEEFINGHASIYKLYDGTIYDQPVLSKNYAIDMLDAGFAYCVDPEDDKKLSRIEPILYDLAHSDKRFRSINCGMSCQTAED